MVEGPPPFAPGFGIVPPVPVGRVEQLDRHARALVRGPADPYFTQAVIGERGVGKTVFLRMLSDRMQAREGWAVAHYQARREREPVADLLELLPDAIASRWRGRGWRAFERELSVQINAAIVKVQGRVTAPADRPPTTDRPPTRMLERACRQIGERAASEHSGLLIAVDEAQALGRRGLGELGMIAQTVAHGQGLPIALAFSGTPELQALLLHSGSFLERMARTELGMLTRDEARLALLEPASRQNVRFDDQALELLLAAAGGYPYFVQLGGYHAWEAALGQSAITRECADRGARAISADADRMFSDRWARLGSTQRHYLAALALLARTHPDGVATRAIADALDREHAQLSTARASLIEEHHLLRTPRRGQIEFAIPRFCAWLQEQLAAGDPRPEFSGLVPPSLGHAPDGRLTPPRT